MLDAYQVYSTFQAIKLHFTSNSYDYFKYDGKTKLCPKETFITKKGIHFYYKIGVKFMEQKELEFALACQFLHNEKFWVANYDHELYLKTRAKHERLTYDYKQEMSKLSGLPSCLKVIDGQLPEVLEKYYGEEISLETLLVLNRFFGIIEKYDEKLKDHPQWPPLSKKMRKFAGWVGPLYTKSKILSETTKEIIEKSNEHILSGQ